MQKKIKYLFKNIFLFTLSGFIPKIISFFLVPIYTRYLTTYQYGISDLIVTTYSLLIPIFTLDIQDAVLRFSIDKKNNPDEVFSIAFKINLFGLIIVLLLSTIFGYFKIIRLPNYFYIFLVIMYFMNAIYNSINLFCRGIDKVKNIVVATIINSFITLIANVLLLMVFKTGIYGFLIANSIGLLISILYLFISIDLNKYINLKTNSSLFKEMIKYSFPLIFSVVAWWINNASDRYILTWIAGASVSGVYAIAYKIPTLLSTFQNIFSQAWSISAIKEFDKKDTDGFVGNMFTIMNFSMCILCSIIMIFNQYIAKILYSGNFLEAWKFVPPLLLSVVFNAMALFLGGIFTAVKDTKFLSLSTIIGALINTVANVILIYSFGAYGAAIATFIGFFVVFLMRVIIVRRHIVMKTNMVLHFVAYILLVAQMVFAYYGNKYIIFEILILISLMMIYIKYFKFAYLKFKQHLKNHLKIK